MRIVFNLCDQNWQTTKSLGILHVSARILRGLAECPEIQRIDVLANRSLAPHLSGLPPATCKLHLATQPAPQGWNRILWDNWSIVRLCNSLRPDWLVLPKGFSPLFAWPRSRVTAYVHDDIFEHYRRKRLVPFRPGEASLFTRMLRRTAKRADLVVANSDFTASEFSRCHHPRRAPIRIGAPIERLPLAPADSPPASLLVPTSAWPHKLTAQAVEWVSRWASSTGFTGQVEGYGTLPADGAWPADRGWTHHGRVTDAQLTELIARAGVLVYFSEYEGYGLPPVEAAASGRRAIASDLPPLRETMPAATLFSNASYDSFADVLTRTLARPPLAPRIVETGRDVAARWVAQLLAR